MPGKDSVEVTSKVLVEMTNSLLIQLNHPIRVLHWTDINAQLFVILYEAIIAEPLSGIIRTPKTTDEEVFNCQKVVDTLANKVLKDNLSHIKGRDIVARKKKSIFNLLEVLAALLEYFLAKIGSETSSENGNVRNEEDIEDPDIVRRELIDDALDREMQTSTTSRNQRSLKVNLKDQQHQGQREISSKALWEPVHEGDTDELIALGSHSSRGSELRYDDKTADLIALGNSRSEGELMRDGVQSRSKLASPAKVTTEKEPVSDHRSSNLSEKSETLEYPPLEEILRTRSERDFNNTASRTQCSDYPSEHPSRVYTHHLYHHFDQQIPPATVPVVNDYNARAFAETNKDRQGPNLSQLSAKDVKRKETTGVNRSINNADKVENGKQSGTFQPTESGGTKKYDYLEAALKQTLHMSREALLTSPFVNTTETDVQTNVPLLKKEVHRNVMEDSNTSMRPASNEKRVTFQAVSLSDHLAAASTSDTSVGSNGSSYAAAAAAAADAIQAKGNTKSATSDKASGTTPSLFRNQLLPETTAQLEADDDVMFRPNNNRGRYRSLSESDLTDYGLLDDIEREQSTIKNKSHRDKTLHDRIEKAVRFDEIFDDSAAGEMNSIQRKLQKETNRVKKGTRIINQVYRDELADQQNDVDVELEELRQHAKQSDKNFRRKTYQKPKSHSAYLRYQEPIVQKKSHPYLRDRKRSRSASPSLGANCAKESIHSEELLPQLLEEFPYLHLSGETLHTMWRKNARQMELLARAGQEIKRNNQVKVQLQDAERRQKILLDMIHRDAEHSRKMKELRERREAQQQVKAQIRDRRQQHVRAKRYYGEYQVQMRSKMLKRRTREEQVFRKLFQEALNIQRDRIRELRSYAKEQRLKRSEQQKTELEAIENYYRDQFAMLKEKLVEEKKEIQLKEKSQTKVIDGMKKELRKKMEREIEQIQSQLYHDEDDIYFRELDAERQRQQLLLARYEAKI